MIASYLYGNFSGALKPVSMRRLAAYFQGFSRLGNL